MSSQAPPAIAVIGGGFSGLICAIHLLLRSSRGGPRIYLIERRQAFGVGAAYSTDNPRHLLNTRALNMSAFGEHPSHFLDWLKARGPQFKGDGATFVSRRTYREYLQSLLRDAACRAEAAGRFYLVPDEAVELRTENGRLALHLKVGKIVTIDSAVIATGNPPPHPPGVPSAAFFDSPCFIGDPWDERALAAIEPTDGIIILGTGLTMIDTMLSLRLRGHAGPVMALSRRGLIPRRHAPASRPMLPLPPLPPRLSLALREVRRAVADAKRTGGTWQDMVDTLRPHTARYWQSLPADDKRRFLRHLRPWWDVHRHRLAPQVADNVADWLRRGDLVIGKGKLIRIELDATGERPQAAVSWRPAGDTLIYKAAAHHVINCIGPGGDPLRSRSPLLRTLLQSGLIRPDPLHLGIEADERGRVVDKNGAISERIFALGPPTRGVFWESTAVPDIRSQAELIAGQALEAVHSLAAEHAS
jgi:uncharacterized NAD(P)/FAD-binding protein YdhS